MNDARPTLPEGEMPRPIVLPTRRLYVHAAPALTFEVVASAGTVVERRSESQRVVEFEARAGGKAIVTTELVTLTPHTRIDYEWLDGPLPFVRETIDVAPVPGGASELRYRGRFLPARGTLNYLAGVFVVRRMFDREVVSHLEAAKRIAEARAARSKRYPRPDGGASRAR